MEWRTETFYNDSAKFVQLEIQDQKPVIAFSSDEGVLMYRRQVSNLPILDQYQEYTGGKNWEKQVVDSKGNTGSFLSMKKFDGNLGLAYQDSSIGDRQTFYTAREDGEWSRERVDWVGGTGLGNGMYTILTHFNDKPVVFSHTSEGRKLVKSTKTGGEWDNQVLETGVGWFMSADSCGSKIHLIYRARDSSGLFNGVYDGGWSSENISGTTNAATTVDAANCRFKAAYFNTGNQEITYRDNTGTEEVDDGKLSRISMEYTGIPKLSYRVYGEGLFYAEKNNGNWEKELVDNRTYAGEYNDLEINDGTIHLAYTQGDKVVYATYGDKGYRVLKSFANIISTVLALFTLSSALFFWRESVREFFLEFLS